MADVNKDMIIGSNTDVISGEGKIVTYGAFDTHVSLISALILKNGELTPRC